MRGLRKARRTLVACGLVLLGTCAMGAGQALANAPNPIPGTTVVDQVAHNNDGTVTVTVQGQWNWASQTDCPTHRNGVGYQVAWFDGNTANPIGTANSPDGILSVGDPQDNIVHSVETLGGSSAFGNAFWNGVPSSYLAHNGSQPGTAADPTPNTTDAKNWLSSCDNEDPTTKISSGTWGPISHTYPAGTTSVTLCPIMYDPHGGHDNSGQSSVKDITAGGAGHNADNSYEANGQDNACLKSSFATPPPSPPPAAPPAATPPPAAPPATPPATKPATKHKKKHKRHVKAKKISRRPHRSAGFTG